MGRIVKSEGRKGLKLKSVVGGGGPSNSEQTLASHVLMANLGTKFNPFLRNQSAK